MSVKTLSRFVMARTHWVHCWGISALYPLIPQCFPVVAIFGFDFSRKNGQINLHMPLDSKPSMKQSASVGILFFLSCFSDLPTVFDFKWISWTNVKFRICHEHLYYVREFLSRYEKKHRKSGYAGNPGGWIYHVCVCWGGGEGERGMKVFWAYSHIWFEPNFFPEGGRIAFWECI